MMRRTKGFTLIELLVVIAIIAMLVSILAPSLTKILRKAKDTKCNTTLDKLRKDMLIFSSQSHRRDFYPNKNNTSGNNQLAILSRFAFEMGIKGDAFVCPATDDNPIVVEKNSAGNNADKGSYSYQTSDITRRITGETGNDVIFIADKAPDAGAGGMSMNHNDGEFLMAASKGGTYRSETENMGRLGNDIFKSDNENPGMGFTLRDDSFLLKVDSAAG